MIDKDTGEITTLPVTRQVFVRAPYNYDTNAASDEVALICPEEDNFTQQQFAEECDINTIVKRFGLTGDLPVNPRPPVSGDFTGITDFQSAMEAVRKAEEGFMEFPAELRARFANDPQQMMEFLSVEDNRAEAIKLGLINPPVEITRDAVKAIDELKNVIVKERPTTT